MLYRKKWCINLARVVLREALEDLVQLVQSKVAAKIFSIYKRS